MGKPGAPAGRALRCSAESRARPSSSCRPYNRHRARARRSSSAVRGRIDRHSLELVEQSVELLPKSPLAARRELLVDFDRLSHAKQHELMLGDRPWFDWPCHE